MKAFKKIEKLSKKEILKCHNAKFKLSFSLKDQKEEVLGTAQGEISAVSLITSPTEKIILTIKECYITELTRIDRIVINFIQKTSSFVIKNDILSGVPNYIKDITGDLRINI